jgi:vitamin-K-epoxide reductase (warfarin-sensitive)
MQAAMSEPRRTPDAAQRENWMTGIALVAVAGVAISSVSLYEHFATSTISFCNFSESLNCDLVNRSAYSTILGVPVALIGIVGYLLVATLATVYRNQPQTPMLLLIASVSGMGFALYLAYVEKFVLGVWCILCLASLGLICIEVILSTVAIVRTTKQVGA